MSAPFACVNELPELPLSCLTTLSDDIHALPSIQPLLEEVIEHFSCADFTRGAAVLQAAAGAAVDKLLAHCLNHIFRDRDFRAQLRESAADSNLEFKQDTPLKVQMPNGHHERISSPWFCKSYNGGRTKVGPKVADSPRKGSHFGLEVMGFFGKVCPTLAFRAVVMASLCPSVATVSSLLADENITLSQNKICDILAAFDDLDYQTRAALSCDEEETCGAQTHRHCRRRRALPRARREERAQA